MEERNDHVIDIVNQNNPTVKSITTKMESLRSLTSEFCIYRVPHRLRRAGEAAYTPKVVSIGPLHHGDEGLEKMEEKKMIYLKDFLERNKVKLEKCVQTVEEGLEGLRRCYGESLSYEKVKDKFVEIIVVDAVFVVETLLKCSHKEFRHDNDRMFNPWILPDVNTEFLLLENQLPFFILEKLWQLETTVSTSLIDCCYTFFEECNLLKNKGEYRKEIKESPKHLLDLLRICYGPGSSIPKKKEKYLEKIKECPMRLFDLLRIFYEPASSTAQGQDGQQNCCCATQAKKKEPVKYIWNATQLQEAGVKFQVRKTNDLLDIYFNKGTFKIPVLEIDDNTESILRNLIAFEQCHDCENYISDYTSVMDCIINTPKDVDLLVQEQIVMNRLGHSDDVCGIINRLGDGVLIGVGNEFRYTHLYEQVDSYCKTSCHKWKATLKHDYFNTPWAIISFIAAVVLIVLTIIQTACSVISAINGE